jgi:hypothetical protein
MVYLLPCTTYHITTLPAHHPYTYYLITTKYLISTSYHQYMLPLWIPLSTSSLHLHHLYYLTIPTATTSWHHQYHYASH